MSHRLWVFSVTLASLVWVADNTRGHPQRLPDPPSPGQSSLLPQDSQYDGIAHTDTGFSSLGGWYAAYCTGAYVFDHYMFLGNGRLLQLVDFAGGTPAVVGEHFIPGFVQDVVVYDSLAYVLSSMLYIFDLRTLPELDLLGSLSLPLGGYRMVVEPPFVFACFSGPGDISQFQCIDVSDPTAPFVRTHGGVSGQPMGFAAGNGHMYLGTNQSATYIIDAIDPDSVSVTLWDFFILMDGIVVDTLMYLAGARPGPWLRSYSVARPAEPAMLGETTLPYLPWRVSATASRLYLTEWAGSSIGTIDISNPTSPIYIRTYVPARWLCHPGGSISSTISRLAVSSTGGALILNTSTPDSAWEEAFVPTGGGTRRISFRGETAFVPSGYGGLWTVDFSVPSKPVALGNLYFGACVVDLLLDDSVAYVVLADVGDASPPPPDSLLGVWTIDVRDPRALNRLGRYPVKGAWSIQKEGDLLYVFRPNNHFPTGDTVMLVLDVSNPTSPVKVGEFLCRLRGTRFVVRDSLAYLAAADSGLVIVDWHRLDAPSILGRKLSRSIGVHLDYPLAYVHEADTLFVLDVSVPDSIEIIGSLQGRPWSSPDEIDLAQSGDLLYWGYSVYLGVVDISVPSSPANLYAWSGGWSVEGITLRRDTMYVAFGHGGIAVWRFVLTDVDEQEDQPGKPAGDLVLCNYPNPFNSTASISFHLEQTEEVQLKVVSILGQVVEVLLHQEVSAGDHTLQWTPKELSSGVYMVCLTAGPRTAVRKVVYIR